MKLLLGAAFGIAVVVGLAGTVMAQSDPFTANT
jgi:hypothetical protein